MPATRWFPLIIATALCVLAVGWAEERACGGGVCVDETQCLEICEDFCDGAVLDAFCSFDEICSCECEFRCF
jgi:hypothetical protein